MVGATSAAGSLIFGSEQATTQLGSGETAARTKTTGWKSSGRGVRNGFTSIIAETGLHYRGADLRKESVMLMKDE